MSDYEKYQKVQLDVACERLALVITAIKSVNDYKVKWDKMATQSSRTTNKYTHRR